MASEKFRNQNDYDDFFESSKELAEEQLIQARVFIEEIVRFIKENHGLDFKEEQKII